MTPVWIAIALVAGVMIGYTIGYSRGFKRGKYGALQVFGRAMSGRSKE